MRKNNSVRQMALTALLAALYVSLTLILPVPQYGGIQIRFAEAMTLLPFLFPGTTSGIVLGCLLVNLFSPFPLDILFGTLATLLACQMTRRMPNRWLAPLPPVLCNALIVGFEIAFTQVGLTEALPAALAFNAVTVAIGEGLACFGLGLPLLDLLEKNKIRL